MEAYSQTRLADGGHDHDLDIDDGDTIVTQQSCSRIHNSFMRFDRVLYARLLDLAFSL